MRRATCGEHVGLEYQVTQSLYYDWNINLNRVLARITTGILVFSLADDCSNSVSPVLISRSAAVIVCSVVTVFVFTLATVYNCAKSV